MSLTNPFQRAKVWYDIGPEIEGMKNTERIYADAIFHLGEIESMNRFVDDDYKIDDSCTLIRFKSGNSFVATLNFDFLVDRLEKFHNPKICFN